MEFDKEKSEDNFEKNEIKNFKPSFSKETSEIQNTNFSKGLSNRMKFIIKWVIIPIALIIILMVTLIILGEVQPTFLYDLG